LWGSQHHHLPPAAASANPGESPAGRPRRSAAGGWEPNCRQPDRGLPPHLCRKTQRHGRRAVSGWACGCATMPLTSPVHCVRAPPFRCVRRGTFLGEATGRPNSSCGRQAAEPLGGCEQLKSDPSRRRVSGPSRESCCCFATPVAGSGRQEDRGLERARYGAIIKLLTIPRTIACGPPRLGASGGGFFLSGHSTHCAGILRDKIDPGLPPSGIGSLPAPSS